MSERDEQLVVRSYSVRRQRVGWVIRIICISAAFAIGFLLGGQVFNSEMAEKRQLKKDYIGLIAERDAVKQALANADVAAEIDRAALEEVRKTLVLLQQQVADGEKELELYRNLMRDDSSPEGLSMRELSLTPVDEGGVAYQLVVQNKTSKLKPMAVRVTLAVEGALAGEWQTFSLHQLDEKVVKSPLDMKFRYFGLVQGVVNLPDNFEPRSVRAEVWQQGQRKKVQKLFDWRLEVP